MKKILSTLQNVYDTIVFQNPIIAIALVLVVTVFFGYHAQNFRLDASSETLALKNDRSLSYYRDIKNRYGSDDYLIVTYTPLEQDVFDNESLAVIKSIQSKLESIEAVHSVTSILNVPLTQSPPLSIKDLEANIITLESADTTLGKEELLSSPFYKSLIISEDGNTTALIVMLKPDSQLNDLTVLLDDARNTSDTLKINLKSLEKDFKVANTAAQKRQHEIIEAVRQSLKPFQKTADIHLGGVPMIASDSIDFIRNDLKIFGIGVFAFLIILLTLFFRKAQWIILPMLTCLSVGICLSGFLGVVDWPVTIVSSNFISLLLIFTLSFCVHQIVRYRECLQEKPNAAQSELVQETIKKIVKPCFFMVLTTIVAFGSLVVSDIKPIIDFGWMMSFGLVFSFIIAFTLFPALLMFLKPEHAVKEQNITEHITRFFAKLAQNHSFPIFITFIAVIIFSIWGATFLNVQNRFIDYYKQHTEIYRGMEIIDNQLGGTTPLDIIIDAPQLFLDNQVEEKAFMAEEGYDFGDSDPILEGYWFSDSAFPDIKNIHKYLESLPETGKVLSFHTAIQILQDLKDAEPLDRFYLGVIYNKLPNDVKDILLKPYISEDGNQLRFSVRVYESRSGLNRDELLQTINNHLSQNLNLGKDQIHQTGMVVLYNNILQSLFRSQILTLWIVFISMFAMFAFLFRNIKVALVAIIPNITITFFVLGLMGWLGIPLDIMTITIAAICFGIADDDTIHYIHRFMEEFNISGNYKKALAHSHNTIGKAMYYTSMTIMFGFSILMFSNFVPTFYFGMLIGISMVTALLADILLLPVLLTWIKPLGKEK